MEIVVLKSSISQLYAPDARRGDNELNGVSRWQNGAKVDCGCPQSHRFVPAASGTRRNHLVSPLDKDPRVDIRGKGQAETWHDRVSVACFNRLTIIYLVKIDFFYIGFEFVPDR